MKKLFKQFGYICPALLNPDLNPLKQLAGQTAIYGLGTIIPRLLNYLLVPLYTRLFFENEYGIITEIYAYIAFFFVLLLYGMETAFFRFAEKVDNPKKVFSTTLISIIFTSLLFVVLVILFINPVSGLLRYENHQDYIIYAAIIIAFDAISAIQFAYLRQQKRPLKFSLIKIITVTVNVALNLYFIWICDILYKSDPDSPFLLFYHPDYRIGYVFMSNVVSSLLSIILLLPQLISITWLFDTKLLKGMLRYAFPLLIVGLAGMVNEVSDKILFRYLARIPEGFSQGEKYIMSELGIYGANYKLAVLMTIFIQMFRYAAEPFFFSHAKENNAKAIYADVLKYFIISGLLIFLGVTLYIDIFKYFIGPEFWGGLYIVPVVLLANLLLGIFYNLSIWYKINDVTKFGAIIAIAGSLVTIAVNILLVPVISYQGSAWGHLICNMVMMVMSYYLGKKHFPIAYDLKTILIYILMAMVVFGIGWHNPAQNPVIRNGLNTLLFLLYLGVVFYREKALKTKPGKV